jgi:arsenical pump membrane protein
MHRTDAGRRAWVARQVALRLRSRAGLVATGVGLGLVLLVTAGAGHAALGRLGDPFALLVALPPLAHGLGAFGLRDLLAARIASIRAGERRLIAAYALWLATSALLTLDVAAVAAGSVAMAIGRDRGERRWQLGAAVLGSNLGSLLFPFSNLTNLVLVAGSGIGLAAYLGASLPAQIAAAAAGGVLLVARFMTEQDSDRDDRPALEDAPLRYPPARRVPPGDDPAPLIAGSFAAAVALVAIVSGFTGGSMVWPFLAGAVIVVVAAVASGRVAPEVIVRSAPVAALLVILVAAIASGPIAGLAGLVPSPRTGDPLTLLAVAAVGGALAALINNLPAAAFGAAWLGAAGPEVIVAYLIGTNFAALITPHGSVATMLARSVARSHGHDAGLRTYLETAWRYAGVASLAAVVALVVVR